MLTMKYMYSSNNDQYSQSDHKHLPFQERTVYEIYELYEEYELCGAPYWIGGGARSPHPLISYLTNYSCQGWISNWNKIQTPIETYKHITEPVVYVLYSTARSLCSDSCPFTFESFQHRASSRLPSNHQVISASVEGTASSSCVRFQTSSRHWRTGIPRNDNLRGTLRTIRQWRSSITPVDKESDPAAALKRFLPFSV